MNPILNKLLLPLSIIILTACVTSKTPQEVVQGYWNATIAQDMTRTRDYIRSAKPQESINKDSSWQGATVSFGEIKLKDNDAWIDTTVKLANQNKPVSLDFITVLKKEPEGWKVDQQKTMDNVQVKRKELASKDSTVNKLVQKLQMLGNQFSEDVDKAQSELQEQMPQIKKDMQSLGKSIDEELRGVLKQFRPTIENGLQEFSDAISNAIEEAKKYPKEETKPDPTIRSI